MSRVLDFFDPMFAHEGGGVDIVQNVPRSWGASAMNFT